MRFVRTAKARGPWHDAGALLSWAAVTLAVVAQVAGAAYAVAAGLVFFVMGLAHGAGDENEGGIARIKLVHAAAYLVTGAAVAGLFLFAPLAGLALFLALSAWHFGRSDCAFAPVTRYAIAGLAVGGSALFRPDATTDAFAVIVGADVPILIVRVLALLGVAGTGAALWAMVRGMRGFGHAVIALGATLAFDPVLAVGLIFLTAHAIPVQQRQIATYGKRTVWRAVALPTLIATTGALAIALLVWTGHLPLPLAIALAFGMATPHMLTERLER